MARFHIRSPWVLTCLALAAWSSPALAQSFTGLGPLAGGNTSRAVAVSDDGLVVVGTLDAPDGSHVFRWTQDAGLVDLGKPAGALWADTTGVSGDGYTIVGRYVRGDDDGYQHAFKWTAIGGFQEPAPLPNGLDTWALGVSGNGSLIVGVSYVNMFPDGIPPRPTMWSNGLTPTSLPSTGPQGSGYAAAISSDGVCVVGAVPRLWGGQYGYTDRPTVWTNGVATELGLLPGTVRGTCTAVSSDGSVVLGTCDLLSSADQVPFAWVNGGGMFPIPTPPDWRYGTPTGFSFNGIMVGWNDFHDGRVQAFVRNNGSGFFPLQTYLENLGLDLTGWTLTQATDISDDGTVIIGVGDHNGAPEAFVANVGLDTDGDGLSDDWEVNGIPYTDVNGAPRRFRLDLNHDGISDANPLRKDIFVEVDSMVGRDPVPNAITRTIEAFRRGAIPPGLTVGGGAVLHVEVNDNQIPARDYPNKFVEFQQDKAQWFGTQAERDDPSHTALLAAKARAFRYCIFAQRYGTQPKELGSSGLAEGISCNDFMVTFGGWNMANRPAWEIEDIHAGTFMHELGHALGLMHGGADDINYKPNYFSTMNYAWQTPYDAYIPSAARNGKFARSFPDYSREVLPTLDESALIETNPIGGRRPTVEFPYSIDLGQTPCGASHACSASDDYSYCMVVQAYENEVDWNNDCGTTSTPVAADINNLDFDAPSPGQVLTGHDDWRALIYDFKMSPYYAAGAAASDGPPEVDVATHDALSARWVPPPCFVVGVPAGGAVCPGQVTSIAATPTGTGPFTYEWNAHSHSGRIIATLSDGVFTDDVTGLSYTVSGATTSTLILYSINLGDHPNAILVSAVVRAPCGLATSDVVELSLKTPDFNQDGNADQDDVAYLVNVVGGGDNTTGLDPDVNSDGNVDQDDVASLINWIGGGACP